MTLSSTEQNRLRQRYGPWAVITGGSSGIGLELATQLAQAGFKLVINARSQEALETAARQLRTQSQAEVRIVVADLADPTGVQTLLDATAALEVGLFVASAGFGTSGRLMDSTLEPELDMIRVNCEALLALTYQYGKQFSTRKRGGIILLSSLVAFQGVPYSAN